MKQAANQFAAFIVYSNIFIAACAFALTAETFFLLRLPASANWYLPLISCCTLFIYNLHYYIKSGKDKVDSRLSWVRRHKPLIRWLLLTSATLIAIGVITHFRQLFFENQVVHFSNIAWFILVPLVSLAYSHRLFPWSKKALRQVGWLKMALLSFTWSFTTTLLPVLMLIPGNLLQASGLQLVVLFIHRFLFIAALSVLFNIKDHVEDKADGVRTIAVVMGQVKTLYYGKWVALFSSLAASTILLLVYRLYHPVFYAALLFPGLLLFLSYHQYRPTEDEAFFVLRYDGLMIIKAVLLIFAMVILTV